MITTEQKRTITTGQDRTRGLEPDRKKDLKKITEQEDDKRK